MHVDEVAAACVQCRDHKRLPVRLDDPEMSNEGLIEDRIDRVAIVIAALRQPVDSRSVRLF